MSFAFCQKPEWVDLGFFFVIGQHGRGCQPCQGTGVNDWSGTEGTRHRGRGSCTCVHARVVLALILDFIDYCVERGLCVEEPETTWTCSDTALKPTAQTESRENCTSK